MPVIIYLSQVSQCHKKVYFQSSNEVLLEGAVEIYGDTHGIYLHKAYKYGIYNYITFYNIL